MKVPTAVSSAIYSPILLAHHFWSARFSYILSLVLLLQRAPVLRHLVELPRQLAPKFADILRATVPLTVGATTTHSLTGATGVVPVRPSTNPADAKVGEPFVWVFRTTGEKAKSYSFSGLPAGIEHSGEVRNAVSSITGTPTSPGEYKVKIIGWENTRQRGRKTPTYTLTLRVTGGLPPEISEQPLGGTFMEGGTARLTVRSTGENLTYRWMKDGQALTGVEANQRELVLEPLTMGHAGSYSVEVTNANGTTVSETASLEVRQQGSYPVWQEAHGIVDPLGDPDQDGLENLVEYAMGSDPRTPSKMATPMLLVEKVNGEAFLVATFPLAADAVDSVLELEWCEDLQGSSWRPIQEGENGAAVTRSHDHLTVRWPASAAEKFLRLKVALKP